MAIDPAGTRPGLAPGAKPDEVVHMSCRKGCGSITARIMKIPNQPNHPPMYVCTGCNHTWGINVGGPVNL